MVEPLVHRVPPDPRDRPEEPSFLMVVVFSAVALGLFLILAFFVLRATASELVPGGMDRSHPHSMLQTVEPPARAA